jgi:hypothetical protein
LRVSSADVVVLATGLGNGVEPGKNVPSEEVERSLGIGLVVAASVHIAANIRIARADLPRRILEPGG